MGQSGQKEGELGTGVFKTGLSMLSRDLWSTLGLLSVADCKWLTCLTYTVNEQMLWTALVKLKCRNWQNVKAKCWFLSPRVHPLEPVEDGTCPWVNSDIYYYVLKMTLCFKTKSPLRETCFPNRSWVKVHIHFPAHLSFFSTSPDCSLGKQTDGGENTSDGHGADKWCWTACNSGVVRSNKAEKHQHNSSGGKRLQNNQASYYKALVWFLFSLHSFWY